LRGGVCVDRLIEDGACWLAGWLAGILASRGLGWLRRIRAGVDPTRLLEQTSSFSRSKSSDDDD